MKLKRLLVVVLLMAALALQIQTAFATDEDDAQLEDEARADCPEGYFDEDSGECGYFEPQEEGEILPQEYGDAYEEEALESESLSSEMSSSSAMSTLSVCTCTFGTNVVCSGSGTVYWTYGSNCPSATINGSLIVQNGCRLYVRGCDLNIGNDIEVNGTSSRIYTLKWLYNYLYRFPDITVGDDVVVDTSAGLSMTDTNLDVAGDMSCGISAILSATASSGYSSNIEVGGDIASGSGCNPTFTGVNLSVADDILVAGLSTLTITGQSDVVVGDMISGSSSSTVRILDGTNARIGNRIQMASNGKVELNSYPHPTGIIFFTNTNYQYSRISLSAADLTIWGYPIMCGNNTASNTICYSPGVLTLNGGNMDIKYSGLANFRTGIYHSGNGNIVIGADNEPNIIDNISEYGIKIYNNDDFSTFKIENTYFPLNNNNSGGTFYRVQHAISVVNCDDPDSTINVVNNTVARVNGVNVAWEAPIYFTNNTVPVVNISGNDISGYDGYPYSLLPEIGYINVDADCNRDIDLTISNNNLVGGPQGPLFAIWVEGRECDSYTDTALIHGNTISASNHFASSHVYNMSDLRYSYNNTSTEFHSLKLSDILLSEIDYNTGNWLLLAPSCLDMYMHDNSMTGDAGVAINGFITKVFVGYSARATISHNEIDADGSVNTGIYLKQHNQFSLNGNSIAINNSYNGVSNGIVVDGSVSADADAIVCNDIDVQSVGIYNIPGSLSAADAFTVGYPYKANRIKVPAGAYHFRLEDYSGSCNYSADWVVENNFSTNTGAWGIVPSIDTVLGCGGIDYDPGYTGTWDSSYQMNCE